MEHCKKCGEKQWSLMDKEYAYLYGQCWSCDKKEWEQGGLSLEEFGQRATACVQQLCDLQASKPHAMTYLDLLRKYKGKITNATKREILEAGIEEREKHGVVMLALHRARITYKQEVKDYLKKQ